MLACFPFSEPEEMHGALFRGFELNVFVDGATANLRNLPDLASKTTRLEGYAPTLPHDPGVRAFDVRFVGRRSECEDATSPLIIVDRMISSKLREVSQS